MDLLLIGLPRDVQDRIHAAATSAGVSVTVVAPGTKPDATRAALAVVAHDAWEAWRTNPVVSRVPVYVVADDKLTPDVMRTLLKEPVAGHGPGSSPALAIDILERFRKLERSNEPPSLTVGSLVSAADLKTSSGWGRTAMVGWGMRGTADFRMAMHAARRSMRRLTEHRPFRTLDPTTWLDLYSHVSFGTGLQGDALEATWTRAEAKKYSRKDPTKFTTDFARYFLAEVPRIPPILLLGESGTGKALAAHDLHAALVEASGGDDLPFHPVNCSTLRDMAEVELFGAMRGAFTSAESTTPGKVIASHGGTLFLDEFGTLEPSAQAKLLLLLQNSSVSPMGWLGGPIHVPVQVIAATNENLAQRVARGEFRADLLYRFGRQIRLPPLRDIKDFDLPYIVDFLLQRDDINPPDAQRTRPVSAVSRPALDKLQEHLYPGNFRELESVIARAAESAGRAGASMLTSGDVAFEASTLPRHDAVVAFVTRQTEHGMEVLLIWNAHWNCFFLPSARVASGLTPEECIERELKAKLRLDPGTYALVPIQGIGEIPAVQYSVREGKLKHHFFRPFRVVTRNTRDRVPGANWLPQNPMAWPSTREQANLSPTLEALRPAFAALPHQ